MVDVTSQTVLTDEFLLERERGNVDPVANVWKVGLLDATFVPSTSYTSLTNVVGSEVSGNGYGRLDLLNKAVTLVSPYIQVTADPVTFTAVGGTLLPKFYFMFDDTHAGDLLIGYGLLDIESGDTLPLLDGKTLTVTPNVLGIYRSQIPA